MQAGIYVVDVSDNKSKTLYPKIRDRIILLISKDLLEEMIEVAER
jgi:hypothetical protein